MAKQPKPTGHKSKQVSMSPLTPSQALAAALQVKKADVDKLEQEKRDKKRKDRGRGGEAK